MLIEAHDDWQISDRRYVSEASMALLRFKQSTVLQPQGDDPSEAIAGQPTDEVPRLALIDRSEAQHNVADPVIGECL